MRIRVSPYKIQNNYGKRISTKKVANNNPIKEPNIEEQAIRLMGDYTSFKISDSEFRKKITGLNKQAKLYSHKIPSWLSDVIKTNATDDSDSTQHRYSVLKILQEVKESKQYKNLIEQDYSKYF